MKAVFVAGLAVEPIIQQAKKKGEQGGGRGRCRGRGYYMTEPSNCLGAVRGWWRVEYGPANLIKSVDAVVVAYSFN